MELLCKVASEHDLLKFLCGGDGSYPLRPDPSMVKQICLTCMEPCGVNLTPIRDT